jgi:hypothetical protein
MYLLRNTLSCLWLSSWLRLSRVSALGATHAGIALLLLVVAAPAAARGRHYLYAINLFAA